MPCEQKTKHNLPDDIEIIFVEINLTLKRLGGGGRSIFSKNISSKERMKPWLFVTFNFFKSYIFPENFIEIPQVVQKI